MYYRNNSIDLEYNNIQDNHIGISVIVAVYNSAAYLKKSIDSLLGQTLTDFELILVDDGSTDNSPSLCDEYARNDNRVIVIHKPNGGVASAREAGQSAAHGAYIIHADPDDWCESQMLEKLYDVAIKEKADITTCDFYEGDSASEERYHALKPPSLENKDYFQAVLIGMHGSLCTRLIKKELITEHNIHFPIGMNYAEDKYVLLWCLCYSKKNAYLNEAFYHYRTNMPSSLSKAYYPHNLLGMAILFRNHCIKEFPYPYNEIAALYREKGFYRQALISDEESVLHDFSQNFSLLKSCFLSSDIMFSNKLLLFIAFYISPFLAHRIMRFRMKFASSSHT